MTLERLSLSPQPWLPPIHKKTHTHTITFNIHNNKQIFQHVLTLERLNNLTIEYTHEASRNTSKFSTDTQFTTRDLTMILKHICWHTQTSVMDSSFLQPFSLGQGVSNVSTHKIYFLQTLKMYYKYKTMYTILYRKI